MEGVFFNANLADRFLPADYLYTHTVRNDQRLLQEITIMI
jgi:hypothetical protein